MAAAVCAGAAWVERMPAVHPQQWPTALWPGGCPAQREKGQKRERWERDKQRRFVFPAKEGGAVFPAGALCCAKKVMHV